MELFEPWARQNLEVVKEGSIEWRVRCPNPSHDDSEPSADFNVRKGVGLCRSCQYVIRANGGEINELTMQVKLLKLRAQELMNPVEEVILKRPEATLNRYSGGLDYWTDPIDASPKGRGLTQETVDMFQLGYDAMADAATIPERRWNGDLIGVTRRFMGEEHKKNRYKYPKGFTAANNLFASWLYEDYDMSTVAITEGAIDAMRIWQVGQPAVCTYGSSISPRHLSIMKRIGVKKVIFYGDGDREGVNVKHRALGWWLQTDGSYKYKPETDMSRDFRFYHVPNHYAYKDAGEMPTEVIQQCLADIETYRFRPKTKIYQQDSPRRHLSKIQSKLSKI